MRIIPRKTFLDELDENLNHMSFGAVFIYPTDTVYGLGCNARNNALVQRIRRIKNSFDQPLSIIAPSKDWIEKNMESKLEFDSWLKKLPGPYTFVMNVKDKDCVSEHVNPFDNTLGIRIPDNWFSEVVEKAGFPIITTSLNIHGEQPHSSIGDIPERLKSMIDFAIDEGEIKGTPSTLVNLTKSPPEILKR